MLLEEPHPVQVLHEGRWVHGWLTAHRRERDGWRGFMRYSTGPGEGYVQWRGGQEMRRPVGVGGLPAADPVAEADSGDDAGCQPDEQATADRGDPVHAPQPVR
jgi:hypothetical protein